MRTRQSRWLLGFAFLFAAMGADARAADEVRDPLLGKKVVDFSLTEVRGKTFRLAEAKEPIVAVIFVGNDCPLARLYVPRMAELSARFRAKGVLLVAINSNQQDRVADIAAQARSQRLDFPVLKDPDGRVAEQFGATRVPEAFVLDRDRVVRFHGRIDDQYFVGISRPKPTREDLALAIEDLLSGQTPRVAQAPLAGCFIGRTPRGPAVADAKVTYTKHIARILQDRCVECHRPGEVAPFSLTNYSEVAPWASTIAEVVEAGRMPPWFADPAYGKFKHSGYLPAEEKRQIADWVAANCPEGDPKDLPEPRAWLLGWGMPKPDVVFSMSDKPYSVPASGVVDYVYYTVDPGWKEDRWLCGAEARPGNRAVVHHILVFLKKPRRFYPRGLPGELIAAYAPGMKPTIADPGYGLHAPAGSKIVFQMHYTPNGTACEDISSAGFLFRDDKDVKWEIKAGMAINLLFKIPPNDANCVIKAGYTIPTDSLLLGVNPHMHLRGKSFLYEAVYPDGRRETLMNCPKFDFNWQIGYQYEEPLPLPKGTRIACTAVFDNSAENPNNPDPNRTVRFGEQTSDEMLIGWFFTAEKRTMGPLRTASAARLPSK